MLEGIPARLNAGSPHYESLVTQLSGPPRGSGATLLAFTGMPALHLRKAAQELSRAVGKNLSLFDVRGPAQGQYESRVNAFFDHASRSNAILLFDESDALFGTRTSVQDSHDRYGNPQVGYVMQQFGRFRGTAIVLEPHPTPSHGSWVGVVQRTVRFPPV